jgi:hypothetical protein
MRPSGGPALCLSGRMPRHRDGRTEVPIDKTCGEGVMPNGVAATRGPRR